MVAGTRVESDPVLVGVDGSEESISAVRWAAREAAMRATGLQIVHAWLWPLFRVPLGGSPLAPPGAGLQARAEGILDRATQVARLVAPGVPVEPVLTVGNPASELLRHAPGAEMVVVGNRGLGGFTGLLLGSTGLALSAHATCPVTVVRGAITTPHGPVLVGIDGSDRDDVTLRLALREAAMRRVGVVVVHAWSPDMTIRGSEHPIGTEVRDYEAARAAGRQEGRTLLEKAVQAVAPDFPGASITPRLGDRSAAAELVADSRGSQLIVVGSRDLGALRGVLFGSTTHAVIHHAACPVLVAR